MEIWNHFPLKKNFLCPAPIWCKTNIQWMFVLHQLKRSVDIKLKRQLRDMRISGQIVRVRSTTQFTWHLFLLPLCNRSVPMSPYRIFPMVWILIFLKHQFFIYVHTKSWQSWKFCKSVLKCKIFPVFHIVQNALSYIIMDSHALFLDHRIVADGIHLGKGYFYF